MLIEKYSNYEEFQAHFENPIIREFIDKKHHELLLSMNNSVHITRIDCQGNRGHDEAADLSFKKEIISN